MEQKNPRVSVVVPVYNTAEFLTQCLQSLKDQIMDDLEIICVDDGSTDNSLEILEACKVHDPRITILAKNHTGYGDSMNQALELANGEYVGFVESTDYVDPGMFIELFALAKKHDADIAKSNFFELRSDGNLMREIILPEETKEPIDPLENTKIFYQTPSIWSGIYRREFLRAKRIKFVDLADSQYEDTSFNFKTLAMANKIVLTDKPFLHYRCNVPRLTIFKTAKVFSINDEFMDAEKYLKNHEVFDKFAAVFQAVKFAEYYWSMSRLSKRDLRTFVLRARVEFFDAKQKNMLKKSYFQHKHWREMNAILKRPPRMFLAFFSRDEASERGTVN